MVLEPKLLKPPQKIRRIAAVTQISSRALILRTSHSYVHACTTRNSLPPIAKKLCICHELRSLKLNAPLLLTHCTRALTTRYPLPPQVRCHDPRSLILTAPLLLTHLQYFPPTHSGTTLSRSPSRWCSCRSLILTTMLFNTNYPAL